MSYFLFFFSFSFRNKEISGEKDHIAACHRDRERGHRIVSLPLNSDAKEISYPKMCVTYYKPRPEFSSLLPSKKSLLFVFGFLFWLIPYRGSVSTAAKS